MPAVNPKSKVLVTGANGYIAMWLVRLLLETGYSVRGTIRSKEKAKHLHKVYQQYGERFEVVVVEDITKEGAFDEAVEGVDAIAHTASPFHSKADEPDELIIPAVRGTVGILSSALAHGSKVKRIAITSSTAAILDPHAPPGKRFTEADWGTASVEQVQREGRAAPGVTKYRASKTMAEQAAWKWMADHKGQVEWDLVVLNPPFVFGPVIHEVSEPSSLNTSAHSWYHNVLREASPDTLKTGGAWIDVRDVALAHVKALEVEKAGGQRFIVSSGVFSWQQWLDVVNALDPAPLGDFAFPKGAPLVEEVTAPIYMVEKGKETLGMEYRTMEETAMDCLKDFGSKGWVN